MPFDGSGNYVPAAAPNFPAIGGAVISSIYYNATINDIVAALNNCLTRDGQGKASAAVSWNGQNLSGVATFTAVTGNFTNLTVTTAPTFAGLTSTAGILVNAVSNFGGVGMGFSHNFAGTVGYHMYNSGGVAEWAIYQPAHASGDDFRIAKLIAGVATTYFNIDLNGNIILPLNNKALYFTDASGTHPYFICQNDNNYVFYGTDAAGGQRSIWSVPMRSSTSVVAFNATPTCPTAAGGDSSTSVATTAFVQGARVAAIQAITSAPTVTPAYLNDMVTVSAQAVALTLANPTGAPTDGWGILIRIKDNGTAQTIAFGTAYRAVGVSLPTTTVISKNLYIGIVYNATDAKWDVLSISQE